MSFDEYICSGEWVPTLANWAKQTCLMIDPISSDVIALIFAGARWAKTGIYRMLRTTFVRSHGQEPGLPRHWEFGKAIIAWPFAGPKRFWLKHVLCNKHFEHVGSLALQLMCKRRKFLKILLLVDSELNSD